MRLGVAGLGRAFTIMLPTFVQDERIALVAAADPRTEAREKFAADFKAHTYASVEELCADASVEAIYVATPHQFHAAHVCMAAAAGKHVLVEKPLAVTLAECRSMINAVERRAFTSLSATVTVSMRLTGARVKSLPAANLASLA